MSRRDQVLSKREKIRELAGRHGACDVRLFGSVARGDGGPDSDVDVIVRFPGGATLAGICELGEHLEALLQCKVASGFACSGLR